MFDHDEIPLLGILRGAAEKDLVPLLEIFSRQRLDYLEITMNTEGAADLIRKACIYKEGRIRIGAGTVLSLKDLKTATRSGAEFIVTPSVCTEVIQVCVKEKIPVFPGAFSPTEIHNAWNLGATMVKVFPAGQLGSDYIKAIKGPFNTIRMMAVGGISEKNAIEYFKAGVDAVGFGSSTIKPVWLKANRYDLIEHSIKELISSCSSR
jgi:2-dehydro-3-deoxyphosphogluconate aldolase/(4S)-4-hydroxy-2-oxoglutarate aldolase